MLPYDHTQFLSRGAESTASPERVNVKGGAISRWITPSGVGGFRAVLTLHEMRRRGVKGALCIGGGQGAPFARALNCQRQRNNAKFARANYERFADMPLSVRITPTSRTPGYHASCIGNSGPMSTAPSSTMWRGQFFGFPACPLGGCTTVAGSQAANS